MAVAEPLTIKGLHVALAGMPVLRDVDLTVGMGEAVALVGGNGSGKSTLVRAALGIIAHQAGSVQLFGQQVAGFRSWSQVGYVPQHAAVAVANATVREIVAAGRLPHRKPFQWLTRRDRQIINDALEQTGVAHRARWPFGALSGGQRQRVLIARALATQPQLLVMDEPLAGVDLHSQQGLAELLGTLRTSGLALLVVLHELGPMAQVLNRFVTLCDGRVVSQPHPLGQDCAPHPEEESPTGLAAPIIEARR